MEKRSLSIAGHRTSVALEPEFWTALEERAADAKGRRGTEIPRPFGFDHKGASALIAVCRTVDAVAPVSGWVVLPRFLSSV